MKLIIISLFVFYILITTSITIKSPLKFKNPLKNIFIDSKVVDIVWKLVNGRTNVIILTELSTIYKSFDEGKTWLKINYKFKDAGRQNIINGIDNESIQKVIKYLITRRRILLRK